MAKVTLIGTECRRCRNTLEFGVKCPCEGDGVQVSVFRCLCGEEWSLTIEASDFGGITLEIHPIIVH